MNEETRIKIINDGIRNGMLIEICLGCGRPITEKGARQSGRKQCNDCPAGSGIDWNPKALEAISK